MASVMNLQTRDEISEDSLLIAAVLGRAHRKAMDLDAPDEARAILHVAHSFADELETTNPGFDRERFIEAVTEDLS